MAVSAALGSLLSVLLFMAVPLGDRAWLFLSTWRAGGRSVEESWLEPSVPPGKGPRVTAAAGVPAGGGQGRAQVVRLAGGRDTDTPQAGHRQPVGAEPQGFWEMVSVRCSRAQRCPAERSALQVEVGRCGPGARSPGNQAPVGPRWPPTSAVLANPLGPLARPREPARGRGGQAGSSLWAESQALAVRRNHRPHNPNRDSHAPRALSRRLWRLPRRWVWAWG